MNDVRVAAAQIYGAPCKSEKNLDRIDCMVQQAAKRKVQIICFPELVISGFDYDEKLRSIYLHASEPVPDGPSTQRLIKIAKNYGMIILAGISEKGDGELRYNTCVIVGPDGYIGKYRKVHMNSERWLYCESSSFPVFDTPYGCIGVSICFDNTFSECARILALRGAEILFSPHGYGKGDRKLLKKSPTTEIKKWRERPMKFMQARALDNAMFVVFPNLVGGPYNNLGASFILDVRGNLMAACNRWREDLAIADLTASALIEARASRNCSLKRRRPSIYSDIVRLA